MHDVGASTVEDENAGTIDVTLPAGDAVEAGTGSTPTTPRSQTGKKTKATVKRKAKRRQHAAGFYRLRKADPFCACCAA